VLRSRCLKPRFINDIVFDLGGVLVDWNPRYLYRKLIKDEVEIERFLTEICHLQWNERQDAGRSFAEGIEELLQKHPQHEQMIRAYFERWPEMLGGAIQGTVDILEQLHRQKRHRLFALSNWSAETFPRAVARFPFLNLFEKVLISGEERLIKPDAKFFALLTERHGVQPQHSLFIDDVEKNTAAASALGFHAIQFTSPEALRQKLSELGVI
jgi:2-haloacid dehalogenase